MSTRVGYFVRHAILGELMSMFEGELPGIKVNIIRGGLTDVSAKTNH